MTETKPQVWLQGEVKTPPFSRPARVEAGFLLRRLQNGESLSMPTSRPLPQVGSNCHELRVVDRQATWRIIYSVTDDAVVVLEVFSKKTRALPKSVLDAAKRRLRRYKQIVQED